MKKHILVIAALAVSAFFYSEHSNSIGANRTTVEQAIRFYTKGTLLNATALPMESSTFLKIFQPKKRHYGSSELISMIQTISQEIAGEYPNQDRLQIGDVANFKGGSIGQHKSHQNGLDADIVYYRKNNKEQDPHWMGRYVEKFVKGGKITENFDIQRNWLLITKLASYPQVERVFVDLKIKKALCGLYSKNDDPLVQQALRILRPAPFHDDHMHVRITCPTGSHRCIPQPPPPNGNGCHQRDLEMNLLEVQMEMAVGC